MRPLIPSLKASKYWIEELALFNSYGEHIRHARGLAHLTASSVTQMLWINHNKLVPRMFTNGLNETLFNNKETLKI